jgi:hypothetical protein
MGYMRWAMTEQAGESRLAPFMTVAGVHVLRVPDQPGREPAPEDVGLDHRQMAEPMIRFLQALSPRQRELLADGQVVNITDAREAVLELELLRHPRSSFDPELARSCPLLAAGLSAVPILRIRPEGATLPQCDAYVMGGHVTFIKHLQLREDGETFWSSSAAKAGAHAAAPREWRVTPSALYCHSLDVTARMLPELLERLKDAEGDVVLGKVAGKTLGELVQDIGDAAGLRLSPFGGCERMPVFAVGDRLPWDAFVEAVFRSGRLVLREHPAVGGLAVIPEPWQADAASACLTEEARDHSVPEVTAHLRSLVPHLLDQPWLDEMPVARERFVDGYDGRLGDLPEAERGWLSHQLRHLFEPDASPEEDFGWLDGTDGLTLRLRLQIQVALAACVPFRVADPGTRSYVPADPPEEYFTALGASRDRPVYCTEQFVLRSY